MSESKPPATPEQRARWRATNAVRKRITMAIGKTAAGRPALSGVNWPDHVDDCGAMPPRLLQFWDKDTPEQVARMFDHSRATCERAGFAHDVLDLHSGRARIAAFRDGAWAVHYDRAPHPAMQADLLRIVDLYENGGIYLDADMVLLDVIPFALPPAPLFVQWASGHRTNVANWFLMSPKGHPVYASILERIEANLAALPIDDEGRYVSTNLVGETGPGPVSLAIEGYLRARPDARDVIVLPVGWSRDFVQPGRRFLDGPIDYKRSGKHWKLPAV